MIIVWIITIGVLALNASAGIGRVGMIFLPILVILFVIMVIRDLFLDGASTGLDDLFSPDWSALTDSSVWIAVYGQIFFSLSIGFGIKSAGAVAMLVLFIVVIWGSLVLSALARRGKVDEETGDLETLPVTTDAELVIHGH